MDTGNRHEKFHQWVPDFDDWPQSWMGVEEDLTYGRKLLPYFADFLDEILDQGRSRKTFVLYRNNLWLLGGTVIGNISDNAEYHLDPLQTLIDAVEDDGILPDGYYRMNRLEEQAFVRMCRKFAKHLGRRYSRDLTPHKGV